MPILESANEFALNGSVFNDIQGDRNNFDYSCHVLNDNSYNNNTTTTIDSNNDSSIRGKSLVQFIYFLIINYSFQWMPWALYNFVRSSGAYHVVCNWLRACSASTGDLSPIEARNCQKEMDAADQAAMLMQLDRALGQIPLPLSQHHFAATERKMARYRAPRQADPYRQPVRQNTDPFPMSSISRFKSNNPFRSLLMRSDVELWSRSSAPHPRNIDGVDVDSDQP